MMVKAKLKWLSLSGFAGAAAGAALAALHGLVIPPGEPAIPAVGTAVLILAGYTLGVLRAFVRQERELVRYVLRLREELRLSQDHLMEGASFSSLGAWLESTGGRLAKPLRQVGEGTTALLKGPGITDAMRETIEQMRRDLGALETEIGPLAKYGLPRPARAPFNLNGLLRGAIDLCRHRAEEKRIVIEEKYSVTPPIFGPSARVQQALLNIVINAIESMPFEGGTIAVDTEHAGGRVVGRVRDKGIGIRPEHLTRIYEPFFTTKPEKSCAGLGLTVARERVEMIGGTIEVRSTPHKGTEVTITFPEAAPLRAGRAGTSSPPEIGRNTADERDRQIA